MACAIDRPTACKTANAVGPAAPVRPLTDGGIFAGISANTGQQGE